MLHQTARTTNATSTKASCFNGESLYQWQQNIRRDQLIERHQRVSSGTDLIGEGRDAERHAFAGETIGLAVKRLVLPILLEE